MKRKWKWLLAIAVVVVVVIVVIVALARSSAQQTLGSLQTQAVKRDSLVASIGATGTIQARQQAVLTFALSGRVGTVNVRMGQQVEEGETLVALDPAYYPQQVVSAQGDLLNAQKALDDLKRSNTSFAQAELDLANAKKARDDAKVDFDNAYEAFYMGQLKEAQDRFNLAESQYNYWRREQIANITGQIQLQKSYQDYIHALQELQKAQADYDAGARGGTKEAQSKLDIAKGKYEVAQARLDDAQARYDSLKNGAPAGDIAVAQARVDATQAVLNQTRITAPFGGTILSVNVLPGDVVNPGTVALVIADLSELHVDVPVAEVDYNRVMLGQPAELVMDAIADKTYHGTVQEIEMSASVTAGTVAYPVKVVLSDKDEKVLPGMTVAVSIEVSRLDGVLLVPNRAVRSLDGTRIVYVLKAGSLTQVDISLGSSNDTMSEVTGGDLKEGDLVVLNPPSTLFTGAQSGGGGARMQGFMQ
jgi:HlyD family secretion protein